MDPNKVDHKPGVVVRPPTQASNQLHRIRGRRHEIVRSSPASIRIKFWALCVVVLLLMVVYGSVYWDMFTQSSETNHWKAGPHRKWDTLPKHFDIHMEDKIFGHAAESEDLFLTTESTRDGRRSNTIAIGCAVTTKNYQNLSPENVEFRLPLLRTLIPSFCSTASGGYDYHFYISFDIDDSNLQSSEYLDKIFKHFDKIRNTLCPTTANFSLHFVQCSHNHNPAWAQNDAMMEAYLDDMEYFYRVNDDTLMLSPSWTETFIEALQGFNPPNVGVVGPVHKGGNEFILTYDFVHRTHIDIFGYYYPRLFTDWWADDWITAVYGQERTMKLPGVKLKHTQEAGQRYKVQFDNGELVHYQVAHDRKTLNRFIYSATNPLNVTSLPKRVVSMSLWGRDPRYTFGALRNAQLMPVFFPGWTMRVYVEENRGDRPPRYDPPPSRIVRKLEYLGVEIVYVNTDQISIAPMMWRFLAADDMSLDCFIVRDSDARINDRDAAIVADWLKTDSPFHCVRDHPSHTQYALSGGMWGARPKPLSKIIPIAWRNLMMGYRKTYGQDMAFLGKMVWHKVGSIAYCHDSISCKSWSGSHAFPVRRRGTEHVGQVFDAFGYARDDDMKIMRDMSPVPQCTLAGAQYAEPVGQGDMVAAGEINSDHLKKLEETIEKRVVHDKFRNALQESFNNEHNIGRHETQLIGFTNTTSAASESWNQPSQQGETHLANVPGIEPKVKAMVWVLDTRACTLCDRYHTPILEPAIDVIHKSLLDVCSSANDCYIDLKNSTQATSTQYLLDVAKSYFVKRYEDNKGFEHVTHFFCSFPSDFCKLYIPFNKPIVLYISGLTSSGKALGLKEWKQTIETFTKNPQNVLVAENMYIAKSIQYYTGTEPLMIPNICSYVNVSYSPRGFSVLVTTIERQSFFEVLWGYLNKLVNQTQIGISLKYNGLPTSKHAFTDAARQSAVVYIPNLSPSSTFCELYKMSIPIFTPSVHLLASWDAKYHLLNHDVGPHPTKSQNNSEQISDTKKWLRFLDAFQKPHVVYFDSVRDLVRKLSTVNLTQVSNQMKSYSQHEEIQTSQQWSFIIR